jgi:DNA-binding transcriptional ArsR family regulator
MKSQEAIGCLAALAQESRLTLYRLLVRRGPEGYAAGEIAERLEIPNPTLSFHLKALSQAGLISARKESRFLFYSANIDRMNGLVAFLTDHCCSLASDAAAATCAPAKPVRRRKIA